MAVSHWCRGVFVTISWLTLCLTVRKIKLLKGLSEFLCINVEVYRMDMVMYKLVNRKPVGFPFEESFKHLKNAKPWDNRIRQAYLGNCRISTVFLNYDHALTRDCEPIIFETMIFASDGSPHGTWRTNSHRKALIMHREIVKAFKAGKLEVNKSNV